LSAAQRDWAVGIGYVFAYVGLDALSFVQPLLKLGITPWNPDAGLTLAFLLLRGWRQVPWTLAAALSAEVLVHHAPGPAWALFCASATIAAGYGALTFELSRRGFDHALGSRRSAFELSLGAALTALVIAVGYAAIFILSGNLPVGSAADAIARTWVGDLNGILTLTPLLLAVPTIAHEGVSLPLPLRRSVGLLASQAMILGALLWLVFRAGRSGDLPLFVLFAPVVWVTLTWGVLGASAAALVIQIGFLLGVAPRLTAASLVETQYFLVTLALTALLLGAILKERARALARVAAAEAEQRALLVTAPDAVLATDDAGVITSANRAAERLFAAASPTLLGTALARWLPEVPLNDSTRRRRVTGRRSDAERFPAEVACVRLNPPARPGYLLIARDMTENDRAQTQLRERDQALSRAMRFALAGELSSALTHELNQPITALVSYLKAAEILGGASAAHDPRLSETLHKATREALRASNVLKRLRDFYRGSVVEVAVVDIPALILEVLSSFADRAERLGVEITREIQVTRDVCTDRTQLQMVLHNLIGNALDAVADTVPGNRRVHVTVSTDGERLQVSVDDSGRGVLLDVRKQLFEPFVTSKVDGMGLGLAISRSLLRNQGGDLSLDESGVTGARFLVELPLTTRRSAA
jgi:two-component system sensor kinase FixL